MVKIDASEMECENSILVEQPITPNWYGGVCECSMRCEVPQGELTPQNSGCGTEQAVIPSMSL